MATPAPTWQDTQSAVTSSTAAAAVRDIYGLTPDVGNAQVPTGTSSYGGDGGDPVNGPGHHETFVNKAVKNVDTVKVDDYLTALVKLSQTNPDQFVKIQQGLFASGFYGLNATPSDIGLGRWTSKTRDALVGAGGALTGFLDIYKTGATTSTFSEWLDKQAALAAADPNSPANKANAGNQPAYKAPLVLTDASTLQSAGNTQAQNELGHALGAAQQTALVNQFQSNERQQYDASGPTGTGATTTQQSPTDMARQFVVNNNLPEYAAHQAEGYMNVFANMFLNGSSQRANTSIGDVAVGGR